MPGAPRRFGMITPPPAAVAETRAPSFRDVGWLVGGPDETPRPALTGPGWIYNGTPTITPRVAGVDPSRKAFRPASRQITLYSDPPELPLGFSLWRLQAIVRKAATQYGSDEYALGHYQPFRNPRPAGGGNGDQPVLAEMHNSAFQPISRGGHVLVSITESNRVGGPAATARQFANTLFGLWQKAWVIGGANIRPLNSVQTPSPQFRGVLPTYGYMTIPPIIGG